MWYLVGIAFIAGFVAGWAFYKHRANVKQAALDEANSLRSSASSAIKPR